MNLDDKIDELLELLDPQLIDLSISTKVNKDGWIEVIIEGLLKAEDYGKT